MHVGTAPLGLHFRPDQDKWVPGGKFFIDASEVAAGGGEKGFRGLCAAVAEQGGDGAAIPNFERVAIVGAGPSGYFTTRRLISALATNA